MCAYSNLHPSKEAFFWGGGGDGVHMWCSCSFTIESFPEVFSLWSDRFIRKDFGIVLCVSSFVWHNKKMLQLRFPYAWSLLHMLRKSFNWESSAQYLDLLHLAKVHSWVTYVSTCCVLQLEFSMLLHSKKCAALLCLALHLPWKLCTCIFKNIWREVNVLLFGLSDYFKTFRERCRS